LLTAYKAEGKWHGITFKEYYHMVQTAAKAFIKVLLSHYLANFNYGCINGTSSLSAVCLLSVCIDC